MTEDRRSSTGETTKRKLKKLVFSALVTQGVVGLGALVVSAQAHGNASTKSAAGQLDWNYDNFVVRREASNNPSSPTTILLQDLERRQTILKNDINTRNQLLNSQSEDLSKRVQSLSDTRRLQEEHAFLGSNFQQLRNTLALSPVSRDVLNELSAGRDAAAIAAVESRSADPVTVLNDYLLVQLDLMNYGAVDGLSTPATLPAVITVSRAGIAFGTARAPNEARLAAALLHNLASAAAPDSGTVTAEQHQIGRKAAIDALALRQQLGDTREIGIAEYMVGVYQYRDRQFTEAEQSFLSSRAKINSTPGNESYGWTTLFLGYTQLALGKPQGQALVDEARTMFTAIGSSFGVKYVQTSVGRN